MKEKIREDYLACRGNMELQDEENRKNSFLINDHRDFEEEHPSESSHQEENKIVEESEVEDSYDMRRQDRKNVKVPKRKRSLSDVVAEMNLKDLQL